MGWSGIPHPFDRFRGSLLNDPRLAGLAEHVDWVEAWNARIVGRSGNERAAGFARRPGPARGRGVRRALRARGGMAYTVLEGDPSTAAGLLRALPSAALVPGRASYVARLLTPVAKLVQRTRGNGRRTARAAAGDRASRGDA